MNHTPGSWGWTYDGSSDYSIGPADDPQVGSVATVWSRDPERGAANCHLIAAAPDLLAALKDMLDHLRSFDDTEEIRAIAIAAIAKAEGR